MESSALLSDFFLSQITQDYAVEKTSYSGKIIFLFK
ncbi:hypothetical protein BPO_0589 [Bergeyella porcorum]|uniref:Uncharacterized protein n=1 Tax=Bergeyella porcorum TaxID=1735111 RepID=A0AAU0F0Z4_9FLAO